jgi:hypothetical protein
MHDLIAQRHLHAPGAKPVLPATCQCIAWQRPAATALDPALYCSMGSSVSAGEDGDMPLNSSLTEGAMSLIMEHPNIVRSLGYEAIPNRSPDATGTHEIRLFMEYCDCGSLDKAVASGVFHEEVDGILRVRKHTHGR